MTLGRSCSAVFDALREWGRHECRESSLEKMSEEGRMEVVMKAGGASR